MAVIERTARLTAAMVNETLRKLTEPIFTKDAFMAMLKSKGRMSFNIHRDRTKWRVQFRQMDLVAGDGNPVNISFPQPNYWKEAELPMRNYNMGTSWNKFEELATMDRANSLFRIADEVTKLMSQDFNQGFRLKLYGDGNSASTPRDLHGLESMFSTSGLIPGGVCGAPNDLYAGLYTTLGQYGGTWNSTYPTGTGKLEYRFWSPLVCYYDATGLSSESTHSWATQWQQAINYVLTYGQILQKGKFDILLLDPQLKMEAENTLIGKQQLMVTQKSSLVDAGIQTTQFNGVEIATEYGVPSGVGYFIPFERVELMSMQGQLLGAMSDRDIHSAQELRAVDYYGNLKFEAPSYFGKIMATPS